VKHGQFDSQHMPEMRQSVAYGGGVCVGQTSPRVRHIMIRLDHKKCIETQEKQTKEADVAAVEKQTPSLSLSPSLPPRHEAMKDAHLEL
jgi:hypothetical protein